MRTTAPNENFNEVFKRVVGSYLKEITGLGEVYYEKGVGAKYPRAVFFFTVWTNDGEARGTLTVRIASNTTAAAADEIAQALLNNLDGAIINTDDIFIYAYSGRISPIEDTDKTIARRLFTADFIANEKGTATK